MLALCINSLLHQTNTHALKYRLEPLRLKTTSRCASRGLNKLDFNPYEHEPLRSLQRPLQYELAKQGIDASPVEAHELFMQKIVHNAKRFLQQDLAEHGIDVSPDEVLAIQSLRIIHLMMEHTVTTDPHEAIERMASNDSSKPYELDE